MPPNLLVDFGRVISHPQPASSVSQLAAGAGLDVETFSRRYWAHRLDYDRGCTAATYWSAVLERDVSDPELADLVRQDVASWCHLNDDTLEVLDQAHQRGATLSLLSNAPHELAVAITGHPAFAMFEHLIFSASLGIAKPDAAVFHAALETMARRPQEVVFIDDMPENVDAAAQIGMVGVLFTSASRLRKELSQ